MGDGDRAQAAERTKCLDRLVIDQADAVPHHVAHRRLDDERALADGDGWTRRNLQQAGFELFHRVAPAFGGQLGQSGPLLAVPADVLPLVLTDRAVFGRG